MKTIRKIVATHVSPYFVKKKEEKLKLNLKIHGIEEGTKKIEHELYRNKMGLVLDISLHILLNTRVGYNTTTDH